MPPFTLHIKDIDAEPNDDTEAAIEQILAIALADWDIDHDGLVGAHRNAVPVNQETLKKFLGYYDGLADSVHDNGYRSQIQKMDQLRTELGKHINTSDDATKSSGQSNPPAEVLIDEIDSTITAIRETRPDDPESVSYALDDLEKQVTELRATLSNRHEQKLSA